MKFKGKPVNVIITGKAKEEYRELNDTVNQEISKGITKSDNQVLLKSIKQNTKNIHK